MRAILTSAVPVFASPTNSSMAFGTVPCARITVGDLICFIILPFYYRESKPVKEKQQEQMLPFLHLLNFSTSEF